MKEPNIIFPSEKIKQLIRYNSISYKIDNSSNGNFIRLDKNENPYLPPLDNFSVSELLQDLRRYPDSFCLNLLNCISEKLNIPESYLLSGNGSDELLDMVIRSYTEKNDKILSVSPSFPMYKIYSQINGAEYISESLKLSLNHSKGIALYNIDEEKFLRLANIAKVIILARPNNPDGSIARRKFILKLLKLNKLTIIDEAYIEFSNKSSMVNLVSKYRNLIVLRTFSKAYGLAGLRLGYGIMDPSIKNVLFQIKSPFNVNRLASKFGTQLIKSQKKVFENIEKIKNTRDEFFKKLIETHNLNQNCLIHPSAGSFFLIRFNSSDTAGAVYRHLLNLKIKVRKYEEIELSSCLRISIGTRSQMDKVLEGMNSFFEVN